MPSIVQSNSTRASSSLAFTNPVGANNTIIVAVGSDNVGDTISISDGVNTYHSLVSFQNAAGNRQIRVFWAFGAAGGSTTISASGITGSPFLAIHEFPPVTSQDVSANASGSTNSASSGNATTNNANELLFGIIAAQPGNVTGLVPGSGFTAAQTATSGTNWAFITEWQFVSAVGSYAATATASVGKGGSFNWGAEIVTFVSQGSSGSSSNDIIQSRLKVLP